ncbi:MAG TPA: hypothetical protein VE778_02210 [Candidatus Bathyarchaeia archaeon]|jgi:hypothetical protein|nr:hypothetical protein [Candidatus Bathyarchaeia archaeon]
MKRLVLILGLLTLIVGVGACKKQASDNDAIRAGILQHLTAVGTLNMSAMDMDIRSVSVNGNQAHAEVEFRPKNNSTPGSGMQVAYNLEKRDARWIVMKTQPLGGMIQHPDPTKNPHNNNPDVHSGALPNFNEILNPPGATAPATLPSGHPPVNPPRPSSQASVQDQTAAKRSN